MRTVLRSSRRNDRKVKWWWSARLGAICGAGVVKGFQGSSHYETLGDGANFVNHGYTKGDGLDSEIVGTFVLVYTVFSATDAKRSARDSHVPIVLN
ncbi:hypothetical protein LguiA_034332 [Lonicera macranthoides]